MEPDMEQAGQPREALAEARSAPDRITVSVMHHRPVAIVAEMGERCSAPRTRRS